MLKFKLAEPVAKKQEKEEIEVEVGLHIDEDGDVVVTLNGEDLIAVCRNGELLDIAGHRMIEKYGLASKDDYNLELT